MPWTSVYVPQVFDAVYAYYLAFDRLARQGKISSVNTILFHRLIQCYSRGNIGSNALRSILVELIIIFFFPLLRFSQSDSTSTLRKVVFDELKKFNNKNTGFVGAQGTTEIHKDGTLNQYHVV